MCSSDLVHKSANGGTTWVAITNGLPTSSLWCLIADVADPDHLYLGTDAGLYVSYNAGQLWQATPFTSPVRDLVQSLQTEGILYAACLMDGVYRIWSEGAGSLLLGQEDVYSTEIEIDPLHPSTLIVAGYYTGGIRWSPNLGGTWYAYDSDQLFDVDIWDLTAFIDTHEETGLYASSGHVGFHRFNPQLAVWEPASIGIPEVRILELAGCAARPNVVYACAQRMAPWRTVDGGRTWQTTPGNEAWGLTLDSDGINPGLAVDPTDPEVAYFSTLYPCQLFRTEDGGESWEPLEDGLPLTANDRIRGIAIDPDEPAIVYISSSQGVYKSYDAGDTWEEKNHGLGSLHLWKIIVDPQTPETVYTTGIAPHYVHKSTDGADHWEPVNLGITGVTEGTSITIHSQDSDLLYLGLCGLETDPYRGSVYMTTNGAASWTEIKLGLPSVIYRPKVRIEEDAGYVWAITPSQGVGVYRRGGMSFAWQAANEGVPDDWCMALEKGGRGDVARAMFLGQRNGSVFYRASSSDRADLAEPINDGGIMAFGIHPHPVSGDRAVISWNLPAATELRVVIRDLEGRSVRTLAHARAHAGPGQLTWDRTDDSGRPVPSGVYYCTLHTETGKLVKPITLLK